MTLHHNDPQPRAYEFAPDTWRIELGGHGCFLLTGTSKAMMVDTGYNKNDLRKFIETLTSLPIEVVNTHGHFDHTGGNGWFDKVYMSPFAATEAKHVFAEGDDKYYPFDYEITTIEEGHIFDLGGRRLETISIPSHSPGSYAYLDVDRRMLFTGDEIDSGQVLLMLSSPDQNCSKVQKHLNNMLKLKARMSEFDVLCPAHNGAPLTKKYFDIFIDIDQRILAGEKGSREVFSPTWPGFGKPADPNWRRMNGPGGAGVVYDQREIR